MATDFDSSPSYTANIQAGQGPLSPPQDNKRGLFGIKKRSNTNLAQAPPTAQSLTSDRGDSVESFHGSETSSSKKKKPNVKNVFKRNRNDSSATMPVGYEDRRDGNRHGGDDDSLESYESDPEATPKLRPKSSGYLSSKQSSVSSPSHASTLPPPTVSNKKSGFFRRSTSPSPADSVMPPSRSSRPTTAQALLEPEKTPAPEPDLRQNDNTPRGQEGSHHSPHSSSSSSSANSSRRPGSLTVPKVNTTTDPSTAPEITATPPTPIESSSEFASVTTVSNGQRRARASSTSKNPSKLSQTTVPSPSPPATRGPESDKENTNGKPVGGFFQSMFSAAQNAATTITNNIPLNLPNQDRNPSRAGSEEKPRSLDPEDRAEPGPQGDQTDREPAVNTLGSGELSLAALGITTEPEQRMMRSRAGTTMSGSSDGRPVNRSQGDVSHFNIERAQTMPVSALDSAPEGRISGEGSKARTPLVEDTVVLSPRVGGDITPDRRSFSGVDDHDLPDRKRSASVRSGGAVSDTKRRHRGSSAASAPNGMQLVPRPTGFAVATKKRNRDFHNLFRSVPEDDYLIEDYGCALQKEILLQGRFYVSEGHICFYSNILGWVTQLVISFDEVVSVEKKSTALLFPNGIVIQTLHARHTFASFITRDATYDLIIGLWNVGHPGLVQSPGEAHLVGVGNDGNESDIEEDEEYEDETDDDLNESFTDAGDGGQEGDAGLAVAKNPSRKVSQPALSGPASNAGSPAGNDEFPGPATHAPTACGDEAAHYDKSLCNEVFPVPIGKIYSLLWGPQSFTFVSHLLTDEEKVLELSIPNNGAWTSEGGKKTRQFTYIKPLPGSIGPKQTKCIITETIDFCDLEDHVTVTVSTQTPDVPSGGVFLVKTKYCLMWAENNSTRIIMNCTVEWSGKSWIKGPVEKGASDGQVNFTKSLMTCLRAELAPKKAAGPPAKGGKGKGKRKKDGSPAVQTVVEEKPAAPAPPENTWGIFEPIKPILSPITDIISPLIPANFTNIVLWVLVFWLILGKFQQGGKEVAVRGPGPSQWESQWRDTELEFWDWLEDRTGLNDLPLGDVTQERNRAFQKVLNQKTASKGMKDHQLKEAISVMEERLGALKRISSEQGRLKDDDEEGGGSSTA